MELVGVIPLVFGALLARVVFRIKSLPYAIAAGAALGVALLLLPVNLLVHWLLPGTACRVILVAQALACVLLGWQARGRVRRLRPELTDLAGAGLLAAIVAAYTFLFLCQRIDDDYAIHTPLIGLFEKGYFPPVNPFLPHLVLRGHYGRDLLIASLAAATGTPFFPMLYAVTIVCHAMTALVVWGGTRALTRDPRAAALATLVIFFGLRVSSGDERPLYRYGLVEGTTNNNAVVHLLFFALLFLYVPTLRRKATAPLLLLGATLGVFAIVYETHFGVLGLAFLACPVLLGALRRRWEARWMRRALVLLALAGALAAVQGGPFTELVRARLRGAPRPPAGRDSGAKANAVFEGMTQEVKIGFPKHPFGAITTFQNRIVPIYTLTYWLDQGAQFAFLPLGLLYVVRRRSALGVLSLLVAGLMLFFPSCVDFGRFNGESFRWIFAAGLGAGLASALVLARVLRWIEGRHGLVRAAVVVAVGTYLGLTCRPEAERIGRILSKAREKPQEFLLRPADLVRVNVPELGAEDWSAAEAVRQRSVKGDNLITNLSARNLLVLATLSGLSGCPVGGCGLRVPRQRYFGTELRPLGFRGRAFLATGDPGLADDLGVRWAYLAADAPSVEQRSRLRAPGSGFRLVYESPSTAGRDRREIYERAREDRPPRRPVPRPPGLEIVGFGLPPGATTETFYTIPLRLRNSGAAPIRGWRATLVHHLQDRDTGDPAGLGDEIRQPLDLELASGAETSAALWFVTPYDPGRYRITFGTIGPTGEEPVASVPDELEFTVR